MAAIDGIRNKIDRGEPLDRDIYDMTPEELDKYPKTPSSLNEAVKVLEKDHKFIVACGVFTNDLIGTWIEWKRENGIELLVLRPHQYEFNLCYDS